MICWSLLVRIQILKTASFWISWEKIQLYTLFICKIKELEQMIFNIPPNSEIVRWSCDVNIRSALLNVLVWNTTKSNFAFEFFYLFFSDMDDYFYLKLKRWIIPELCSSGIKDCCHYGFHLMRWMASYSVLKAKCLCKVLLDLTL